MTQLVYYSEPVFKNRVEEGKSHEEFTFPFTHFSFNINRRSAKLSDH